MILYPAIDLRAGNCVRLMRGELEAQTVFSYAPEEMARHWVGLGAEWLHVVNLDGAFSLSGSANLAALQRIINAVNVPIQFGGGLRSVEQVEQVFEMGVTRVVLGTAAIDHPELVKDLLARWGAERVALGIDARGGFVATQGWTHTTAVRAVELAQRYARKGVTRVIYTDIARDGMQTGVDADAMAELAEAAGLGVIASGGVGGLEDIRNLVAVTGRGVEGVIIGMALYRGTVDLSQALQIARGD
ncbi:MAG: 1-(5-phosphoribosyl)-5-[(5-phosphoribosylamino)methylideneamino]imidazole-4-carboxamide isomerase [Chloroflexi bacterium]|nr:1-(5-phosphoribosyl)-5-[(5-phosphoribosylamino)methylideneamino]imidazole-4-carboxamide isomerase [Chloroflexota bacterium]